MYYTVETSETEPSILIERFKQSCQKRQFGVLISHNFKQKFNEKQIEYDEECIVCEICNPVIASSVVKSNRMIALALPCRVMIYSEVKGGPLKMTTMLPTQLIGMIDSDNETAAKEAKIVEQISKEIMDDCK
ncbi:predicted protein [Naegleria gruberi]|uniref:Predicted protein n=1 Tax=Naegleria gruberi TaxID=5762 RepID=D2V5F4_NAEGR|nr:uncharacterized protein NAEGRDRAFT_63803 [Naegleria gruberi]EFC48105.1 predicted protein [Naegleria gruberi]|eukprot:XP_002680849.1 predicted protein [Naegleria gruberi strain NEG-M]